MVTNTTTELINRPIKHLGIILDGNRRYAKKLNLSTKSGHEAGLKNLKNLILEWVPEFNIKELTLYTFSVQNFNRSKEEVGYLLELFKTGLTKFLEENIKLIKKEGIRINFVGRLDMFPKNLREMMNKIKEKTKTHTKRIINFAMAYGGREEIIDGIKRAAKDLIKNNKKNVTEAIDNFDQEKFSKYLYLKSEPEIIIRTGGDKRTSNFLIWQSWYSEWFFLDKFWPEFTKQDLVQVINSYQARERRFGY